MTTGMKQLHRVDPGRLDVIGDVLDELTRARAKYPDFHSSHEGHSLIREELEELWELVRDDHSTRPSEDIACKDTYRSEMRAEAVQIAAMAIRFIEDLCDEPNGDK